jgi:hypothetical protein
VFQAPVPLALQTLTAQNLTNEAIVRMLQPKPQAGIHLERCAPGSEEFRAAELEVSVIEDHLRQLTGIATSAAVAPVGGAETTAAAAGSGPTICALRLPLGKRWCLSGIKFFIRGSVFLPLGTPKIKRLIRKYGGLTAQKITPEIDYALLGSDSECSSK